MIGKRKEEHGRRRKNQKFGGEVRSLEKKRYLAEGWRKKTARVLSLKNNQFDGGIKPSTP